MDWAQSRRVCVFILSIVFQIKYFVYLFLYFRVFNEPDLDLLEGATSVFTDQVALQVVAGITSTPSGHSDLNLIYHLIRNNSDWLLQQMNIQPPLPVAQKKMGTATPLRFQVNLDANYEVEHVFSPVSEFNLIGAWSFDQVCARHE